MNYYKIEDKELKVPTKWSDVSFETYIKLKSGNYKGDDQIISLLTGMSLEEARSLKVGTSFKQLIKDLSFSLKDIDPDYVPDPKFTFKGKEYKMPLDIGKETVGQYTDLKGLIDSEGLENCAKAFSIYLQPLIDGVYNLSKAKELVNDVYQLPSDMVLCMGGFFLENAYGLKNLFMSSYRKVITPQTKFKRVMRHWQITMASYLR